MQEIVPEQCVRSGNGAGAVYPRYVRQGRFWLLRPPCPEIAEPEGRQDVDHALVGPPIAYADLDQQVGRRGLCVFVKDVEIPVFIKYACLDQFVFGIRTTAMPVGLYKMHIGILLLRLLIEILHVRVSWRAVQIVVIFLNVLPVIGLAVGQAKCALLEYRILAVPQRQRKTQPLVIVTETGKAVLAPMIGA